MFWVATKRPQNQSNDQHPPTPTTQISQLSYSHCMTGMGLSFHERAMQLTNCPTCGNSMNQGNLRNHMLTVHRDLPGIATLASTTNPNSQDGLLFINLTPDQKAYAQCPIPYCRVPIKGWDGMRRHFQHRHHTNGIYNIHEGYFPRCQRCGLQCRTTDRPPAISTMRTRTDTISVPTTTNTTTLHTSHQIHSQQNRN